jgi:hypothetical protein
MADLMANQEIVYFLGDVLPHGKDKDAILNIEGSRRDIAVLDRDVFRSEQPGQACL